MNHGRKRPARRRSRGGVGPYLTYLEKKTYEFDANMTLRPGSLRTALTAAAKAFRRHYYSSIYDNHIALWRVVESPTDESAVVDVSYFAKDRVVALLYTTGRSNAYRSPVKMACLLGNLNRFISSEARRTGTTPVLSVMKRGQRG